MKKQTCNCHPFSPFHWANHPQPSIFFQDPSFRAKGTSGKSTEQLASEAVDRLRQAGKSVGTIHNLGATSKEKELALIAYKQFGIYTRAKPNVKPTANKHEI